MRRSRPGLPYLLILPSLVLAFWIIGYPVYDVADISLHDVNRFGQVADFAGLANFRSLFADPLFLPLPVAHAGLDRSPWSAARCCSPCRSR